MASGEREAKLRLFTSGQIRFLFNAMLLTTGFDYPAIDCIVMLRPTKSTGLYVQIMGRGLRLHEDKQNTLVLDFAGNIERHGPIDQIRVKRKGPKAELSIAPVKECPDCHELLHTSVALCPSCGHEFPRSNPHGTQAADGVIVAALAQPTVHAVTEVTYSRHQKLGKPPTVRVEYQCGISTFTEFLPIEDERSFVRKHAVSWCWSRGIVCPDTVEQFLELADAGRVPVPHTITVRPDGKYWKVIDAAINMNQPMGVVA